MVNKKILRFWVSGNVFYQCFYVLNATIDSAIVNFMDKPKVVYGQLNQIYNVIAAEHLSKFSLFMAEK